jgi:ATP-dependent DNA helicase RecG
MQAAALREIIALGEGSQLEFKSSFNVEAIEALVAFANTAGGMVLIGLADDGEVKGVSVGRESLQNWINEIKTKTSPILIPEAEIIDIDGRQVVALSIQEYPVKPVSLRGKYYKRVANANHVLSTSEVVNLHLQTFNTSWDYHPNPQFSIEDISLDKVQAAIELLNRDRISISEDPLTFLIKNDLLREGAVTNAAYLLFKKEDSVLTTIELGRFQTDTIIKDTARSKADLLTQVEDVLAFIKKHINKAVIITGAAQNLEKWQFPLEAIREIVMNMIVHRDYRLASDSVVKVYDHKIEFYNPGRLPERVSIEDLLSNQYPSTPRNKLIADFCKTLGLIEKYGSGIRRILHSLQTEGLPPPTFQHVGEGFMVTIYDREYLAKHPDAVAEPEPAAAKPGLAAWLRSAKGFLKTSTSR